MQAWIDARRSMAAICAAVLAAGVLVAGQTQTEEFEPQVGQAGKDVVWVPTPQELVDTMLKMAGVTPDDYVIDLGSGDGRTVISAAKLGARARGVEYNPDMVALSRRRAEAEGVSNRATFDRGDLFEADLTGATVITLFLLPDMNLKLRPSLLDLPPGTRVVSNTFSMDDWEPDETYRIPDCPSWCTALLWIVPAKVAGTWRTPQGELTLTQTFQMVSGTLQSGATKASVSGKLEGADISFSGGGVDYTARVDGDTMTGTASPGGSWTATRAGQ